MDNWKRPVDNRFAQETFRTIDLLESGVVPQDDGPVCATCTMMTIWDPSFTINLSIEDLKARQSACKLCHLILDAFLQSHILDRSKVQLYRLDSGLGLSRQGPPVLSICSLPGTSYTIQKLLNVH